MGKHGFSSEHGEIADVLESAFAQSIIYNHGKGQWHIADAKTGLWLNDRIKDVPKLVDALASERMDALWPLSKQGDKDAEAGIKIWRKLRNQNHLASTLEALAQRDDYKTDGTKFDQQPYLLGVKNGVVDLETQTLYSGAEARKFYVSQSCAVEWPDMTMEEAIAEAKPFIDFLEDVMSHDADVTQYVLRLLGYCLLGTTEEEKFWLMVGDGRNGKGTLTKFILWLLGDYGAPLDPTLYIRGRWGDTEAERAKPALGSLWGKRYTVTSEPVKGAFNDEMIKAHTGRDPITFRRMRSDTMWRFDPTHKLFFLTQQAPSVEDVGPSMRARARVIQFQQSYVGREDRHLKEKLEKIGPAVLKVLAAYAAVYLKDGLPESEQVLAWSDAYINENDPLAQFVDERCEKKTGTKAQSTLVFDAYTDWANAQGVEPLTQTSFGRKLGTKYPKKHERNGWYYHGIRLLGASEVAESDEEDEND